MPASPKEVIRVYLDELYAKKRLELAPQLLADPTWRHETGKLEKLSLRESMERLERNFGHWPGMRFDNIVEIAEGDKVAAVYNGWCTRADGKVDEISGIEVFRVRDGRIVEVWNSKILAGLWQASPLD